ncbi:MULTISPECIES: SPOR domain-containing protein [Pseudoxanthomonas]|uniref:Cell division protein FtsN n=1 Tax=Pseudoxanthomonas winnipegensis TaxID=2480810 RepID=A0AAW8G684_9GAMM|nr:MULTISPECIES: SPOR domain-containing protein [Pseudoxanthomonas]MDQ1117756.1 cell division protein FtsN [Pseudoxanthomonas winnipegensis]MDQ1134724.1 cell division protein FtsN [Pseudoxanthomonas winnipegensis]MDR6139043.1 cell division protein FtsN [Pseudoxanthomonas sp. SORGH_AS_0997]
MLIRALILLLVVLNLGVAAWWLMAPSSPAPVTTAQVDGLPLLETPTPQQLAQARRAAASRPAVEAPPSPQLVEAKPSTAVPATPAPQAKPVAPPKPAPVAAPTSAPEPPPKPAPLACTALGPFDSEAEARAAQGRLKPAPASARLRSQNQPARAYSVMAPFADRAAAEDMARRITAAGFDDLMVISNGPSSGVALGRYSTREAAQRRQRDLEAAGFDARMEAVGPEGPVQWWLDVRASAPATALQGQAGATRAVAQDCARASG